MRDWASCMGSMRPRAATDWKVGGTRPVSPAFSRFRSPNPCRLESRRDSRIPGSHPLSSSRSLPAVQPHNPHEHPSPDPDASIRRVVVDPDGRRRPRPTTSAAALAGRSDPSQDRDPLRPGSFPRRRPVEPRVGSEAPRGTRTQRTGARGTGTRGPRAGNKRNAAAAAFAKTRRIALRTAGRGTWIDAKVAHEARRPGTGKSRNWNVKWTMPGVKSGNCWRTGTRTKPGNCASTRPR